MLRYALGVLTVFLFLASVGAMLYLFDQGEVVDLKPSTLAALSRIPGWEDVYETYNIGRLEARVLEEKEQLLAEREQALANLRQQMEEKEAAWTEAWEEERSEEHTSELQSRPHLVCRLLLEKKKKE